MTKWLGSRYYYCAAFPTVGALEVEIERMKSRNYHASTLTEKTVTNHRIQELEAAIAIKKAKGR